MSDVRADVREQQRGVDLRGALRIGHDVQGIDRCPDQLRRILSTRERLRDDDREGLAHESQPIASERLAIERLVQLPAGSLHVARRRLRGELQVTRRIHGGHARHRTSVIQTLHAQQARMGEDGADEDRP